MSELIANRLINLTKAERYYCLAYISTKTFARWAKRQDFKEKIRLHMGGEPLSWWARVMEGSKDVIIK